MSLALSVENNFIEFSGERIPLSIQKRKVRRLRLEYGPRGLTLIMPLNSTCKIDEVLSPHKRWILKRESERMEACRRVISGDIRVRKNPEALREHIKTLTQKAQEALGVKVSRITVRNMKTRWGSMGPKKSMNISSWTACLPDNLIRYIVYHELAHIIQPNHGSEFYKIIGKFFPDLKDIDKELKIYFFAAGMLAERGDL
ncbi:MAG: M48 family metallopeptidase [Elusimicrobia bacterium]|nr:M48 family metallopeptidase [Elusimicrobiota bacterium]